MNPQCSILKVLELGEITLNLGSACCDPCLLGRLSVTQRTLHDIISAREFAVHVARALTSQDVPWAKACSSLEEISLGMDVEKICSRRTKNHLYFQMGGGTSVQPVSKPLLNSAAALGRKHRCLSFHIDSHVAPGAPAGMATSISQQRASSVKAELGNRGIDEDRVSIRAWGRKISSVWDEPSDATAARSELFFILGGVQFPPRKEYYGLVAEDKIPPLGTTEEPSDDEGQEQRLVRLRNGQVLPLGLLRRLLARMHGESDDENDNDSSDADDRGEDNEDSSSSEDNESSEILAVLASPDSSDADGNEQGLGALL
mmetsp:Transcript_23047/g.36084  ORF Transcript_23047/g.36084 Transcript_23047/m.36084 type:complete len:315 (-) Transcript_23047:8-952(-)